MRPRSIRISIDLPPELNRRLREAAARQGCSARQLILAAIERIVAEAAPQHLSRRLSLDPPLISPAGRCIDLTNDQIYGLIEFP